MFMNEVVKGVLSIDDVLFTLFLVFIGYISIKTFLIFIFGVMVNIKNDISRILAKRKYEYEENRSFQLKYQNGISEHNKSHHIIHTKTGVVNKQIHKE